MAQCCCRRSHSRLVLQVKLKQGLKIAMSISGEGNAYLQVLKQLNLPPEMKVPLSDEKGDIGRASSPWEILLVGYKIGMPEPLFKELAKPLLAKNDIKKLVDPSLVGAYDSRGDDLGEGGYGVVYRGHLINGTPRWYCPLVATACASAAFMWYMHQLLVHSGNGQVKVKVKVKMKRAQVTQNAIHILFMYFFFSIVMLN